MNCEETLALLREHCEGALPDAVRTAVQRHLMGCGDCRMAQLREQRLMSALRSQPVVTPHPDFARRALRRARRPLRAPRPPSHRRGFAGGFASATAIAAAAWALVTVLEPPEPADAEPVIAMALHQVHRVGVVIDSPADLQGVSVDLVLPPHFELAGYPGKQYLTWTTHLAKGENMLSLPIIARRQGEDELFVNLQHEQKTRSFRVRLGAAVSANPPAPAAVSG